MAQQVGEADADQPHHGGAGGGDLGLQGAVPGAVVQAVRQQLRGGGGFEHVVKADGQQAVEHDIDIVQVVELPVKGGVGDGDVILEAFQHIEIAAGGLHRLVGAHLDAGAAVDAAVGQDGGLAAAHPDGFCGAALDAGGAAPAFFQVEGDRVAHAGYLLRV